MDKQEENTKEWIDRFKEVSNELHHPDSREWMLEVLREAYKSIIDDLFDQLKE